MLSSWMKALLGTLVLIALLFPSCDGHGHGHIRKHHSRKSHRPHFKPGPWKKGRATFYEGSATSFGGACGYEDVVKEGLGLNTASVSTEMFKNGQTCGACYELKCVNSPECKPGQPSLFLTATNQCGAWGSPPLDHFDIAKQFFSTLAEHKAGVLPVQHRRVSCKRVGGIRFTITGNPSHNIVSVSNVGGAGDVIEMHVKGHHKLPWTPMTRSWGQKWITPCMLVGESLTFRVRASDGRFSTSWHVVPRTWKFGQTFIGKNFR